MSAQPKGVIPLPVFQISVQAAVNGDGSTSYNIRGIEQGIVGSQLSPAVCLAMLAECVTTFLKMSVMAQQGIQVATENQTVN